MDNRSSVVRFRSALGMERGDIYRLPLASVMGFREALALTDRRR